MPPGRKSTRHQPAESLAREVARFYDAKAQELWGTKFHDRPLLIERNVILSELNHTPVPNIIRERGWENLVTNLPRHSKNLVEEFYANIHAIGDDYSFTTLLRGVTIRVTPSLISSIHRVPRVEHSDYPYDPSSPLCPSKPVMATLFCANDGSWDSGSNIIYTSRFTDDTLALCHVMFYNLFPIRHTSDIGVTRARFLYALLTGVPIDFGRHFCSVILEAFETKAKRKCLPFPCLITLIALAHQVPLPRNDPIVSHTTAIGNSTLQLSLSHLKRAAPPRPNVHNLKRAAPPRPNVHKEVTQLAPALEIPSSTSDGPSTSTAPALVTLQTVMEFIVGMEERLSARLDCLEQRQSRLEQRQSRLEQDVRTIPSLADR
ncbi:hypothetical protein F2P56_008282 [Juglans regia]|uniref:Uncharacterized protein LOC108995167 n=2 Tax=Juglans regia TaxID=51240 RepID=A0A2I4F3I5_JUGRE|nr:uncharacterized protein LOC108995167 [Juglans regia]KAF5471494.1 hypothetical protein F2P56_008282 [Juglans regia]